MLENPDKDYDEYPTPMMVDLEKDLGLKVKEHSPLAKAKKNVYRC